jgi:multidrug resistance efflux pump
MTIRAPMNGVAVLNSIWLGSRMGTVQKGDSVQPGVPFMQVVDPSQMEVRAMVSQSDLDRVHAGQGATAHFDAYPGMSLPALLTEISPLGEQGKFSKRERKTSGAGMKPAPHVSEENSVLIASSFFNVVLAASFHANFCLAV